MTIPPLAIVLYSLGVLFAVLAYVYRRGSTAIFGVAPWIALAALSLSTVAGGTYVALQQVLQGTVRAVNVSDVNQLQDPSDPRLFANGTTKLYFVANGTRMSTGAHSSPSQLRVYQQSASDTGLADRRLRTLPLLDAPLPATPVALATTLLAGREFVLVGTADRILWTQVGSSPTSQYQQLTVQGTLLCLAGHAATCLAVVGTNQGLQVFEVRPVENRLVALGPIAPGYTEPQDLLVSPAATVACVLRAKDNQQALRLLRMEGSGTNLRWLVSPVNLLEPRSLSRGTQGLIATATHNGRPVLVSGTSFAVVTDVQFDVIHSVASNGQVDAVLGSDANGTALFRFEAGKLVDRHPLSIGTSTDCRSLVPHGNGWAFLCDRQRIWRVATQDSSHLPTNGDANHRIQTLHAAFGSAWFAGSGMATENANTTPAAEIGTNLGVELWVFAES